MMQNTQNKFEIQSVKRISDGVIFSIGDYIGINNTTPEIFKITIDNFWCYLHYYSWDTNTNFTLSINDAIKIEGKDIKQKPHNINVKEI